MYQSSWKSEQQAEMGDKTLIENILGKEQERSNINIKLIATWKLYNNQQLMKTQESLRVLRLLDQQQVTQIQKSARLSECSFSVVNNFSYETIFLQIRGQFLIQVGPRNKDLISGLRIDRNLEYQIHCLPKSQEWEEEQRIKKVQKESRQTKITLFSSQSNEEQLELTLLADRLHLEQFIKSRLIWSRGFGNSFKCKRILTKDDEVSVYLASSLQNGGQKMIYASSKQLEKNGEVPPLFKWSEIISSRILHRYVQKLEEFYSSSNTRYLVAENFKFSLAGVLAGENEISFAEKKLLIRKILQAVSFLHSREVIHKNLDETTIFLKDMEKLDPKICSLHHIDLPKIEDPKSSKTAEQSQGNSEGMQEIFSELKAQAMLSLGLLFAKILLCGNNKLSKHGNPSQLSSNSLGEKGQDFIGGLLTSQDSERLTAAEALKHPFLNDELMNLPQEIKSIKISLNSF